MRPQRDMKKIIKRSRRKGEWKKNKRERKKRERETEDASQFKLLSIKDKVIDII